MHRKSGFERIARWTAWKSITKTWFDVAIHQDGEAFGLASSF
jgi:hypothetical protein